MLCHLTYFYLSRSQVYIWIYSQTKYQPHQKRGIILSQPILGVISPLSAYSLIDNSYYLISLVNGHWSFEILSHGTHSTIFDDIVYSDLTSHTCIISIICVYNCHIDKMLWTLYICMWEKLIPESCSAWNLFASCFKLTVVIYRATVIYKTK